jgi:hypothetical protein
MCPMTQDAWSAPGDHARAATIDYGALQLALNLVLLALKGLFQ